MKRFYFFYNSFFVMLLLTVTAGAYIDPSVTTYVIQAVAGIAIAVGAAVGIFWHRAKKKAQEKLGINFEEKKTVEEGPIDGQITMEELIKQTEEAG